MNKKAQELELRNIMQGLEEFATFVSFRSNNTTGLRIISVESVAQPAPVMPKNRTARILKTHQQSAQSTRHVKQSLNKPFSFNDRDYH